jgi:signal transduction histidine kinase
MVEGVRIVMRAIKALRQLWQPARTVASPEFLAWRQRFLSDRIPLLAWVALIVLILITVLNISITIPSLNVSGDPKLTFDPVKLREYLEAVVAQILSIGVFLLLFKNHRLQQLPERMFLLFSGMFLLSIQLIAALHGQVRFDALGWIFFYAMQAILIPVYWRLHVLSQLVVIGYFAIAALLGLRDPNVIFAAGYVIGGFYTAIICLVADVGVFLYEHALQREFDLRQQLRVFLHAVSHDLRNPVLGTVMTLKSFLKPSGEDAHISQEMLEQIVASGERQVELINSLLETHSTELYGITIHTQPIQLDGLVNSVITDFQPFFQRVKTTLNQEIPPNLPLINADALQLRRVYENLISNALKYNRPGLHLTLSAEIVEHSQQRSSRLAKCSQWVRCTVSDNGIGMTQQQCDRLFDLYTRGPYQRQSLSLGLGLYMCRQIITAHGGEIGIISSPGNGATFWFTLPIQQQ